MNDHNNDNNNNIWIAASDGNLQIVQDLILNNHLNINIQDENGYTPLQAAAAYNHIELLKWLLENGADVTLADNDMDTPLHHCETKECAEILIHYGASLTAKNSENKIPLDIAKEEDNTELIKYLENL